MTLAYLVTEGQSDVDILKKLLPEKIAKETKFVVGKGQYSAQSLAGTLLAVKSLPVALVIDADTEDELAIREKSELLYYLLSQASPKIPFQIFTPIPEIEAIFVSDREILEKIIKRNINDLEWQLAKYHPKEFLSKSLKQEPLVIETILANLSLEMIQCLQKSPLIKGISDFLGSFSQGF
jgi:hypothetical protein